MAPKKRGTRENSKALPSVETDGEPAPLLPENTEAGGLQRYKSWTPIPREEEEFIGWARKHWGDRYLELYEARRREKDYLKDPLKYYDMEQEMLRIQREKAKEHERKKKAALGDEYIPDRFVPLDDTTSDNASPPPDDIDNGNLKRGKTWQELMAWARMHYGEGWYAQRQVLEREEREDEEQGKISSKTIKRGRVVREVELERDEGILAEGKTWREIMAWPADPSIILPSVKTGVDIVSSPSSSSEHSDGSGYSTYPPTPTDARRQAMDGPLGPDGRWRWRWERLEWDAVRSRMSEAQYEKKKVEMVARIKSLHEDQEFKRRNDAEKAAMNDLKWRDPDKYSVEKTKYKRRIRDLDLRGKGWTQEQIDAADRADTAVWEWQLQNPQPRQFSLSGPPLTQEEMDSYDTWLQRERAARLRIYGGLPPSESGTIGQAAHDTWRQNIHARVSSQHEQTPRATINTSRKTHGGRITKNTVQSQRTAPTRITQPDRALQSKPHNTRQRKVYKQERGSRRLAGCLPEYGMLPKRGELAPPYQPPSNTRKPNPSGSRSRTSSKRTVAVKGTKPRGIAKSGREGTSRPKRSKKGS